MPRVIDLFAGAGGFGLGFKQAGYHVEHAIEIDPWACETLLANNAADGLRVWCENISQVSDDRIRKEIEGSPDVLIGGPPCQGFSQANNGKDPRDPRNSLFREFLRFVRVLEPRVVLMENVPGILRARTASDRRVIEIIEAELRSLGYGVQTEVLEAADYGVPQLRRRVIVCAVAGGREISPGPRRTHAPLVRAGDERAYLSPYLTLWDAIGDLPCVDVGSRTEFLEFERPAENAYQMEMREETTGVFNHIPMKHTPRMVQRFAQIGWGESQSDVAPEHAPRARNSNGETLGKRYDQNNRRMKPDQPCHTIPASFYANFIHPYLHRNFTAREGARIQSFPDTYVFKGKATVVSHKLLTREGRHDEVKLCQYNQIGNAVPPRLAKTIAQHLQQEVFGR